MHFPPLHPTTSTPPAPPPSRQLKQAAQEFEGMLISSLWKEMQDDPMAAPDDSDPGGGSIRSLGLQAMSTALSASGGLGWAKMVEKQLAPQEGAPPPSAIRALKPLPGPADKQIERFQAAAGGTP